MHSEIKEIIFKHLNFEFDGEISFVNHEGVYAKCSESGAVIGFEDKTTLCRALFMFAMEYSKGRRNFEISQKKHFKECGVMIDCSRNAVLTVESAKKYIKSMAALGLNLLMLYTEDTYEIPEYPYFGYLRGRYTKEEIKEIDAYAQKFGIEVVPCIQTLAHLSKFLKWKKPIILRDTPDILLIDEPETYKFIEAAIKSVSEMFTSNRIHIGMDEAHNVGLGKYLDKHGYQNRFELLTRHLSKVTDICKKYNLKPMMWSDMYFRLASKTSDYYDDSNDIPQNIIDIIPNVDMVYWDYYSDTEEKYDRQIAKHKMLNKPVVFAGGIQTWYGHLPRFDSTLRTSIPALKSCLKNNVDTVLATQWGDDGNECNILYAEALLPVFSEYFYYGKDCTEENMKDASEFLTGQPYEVTKVIGDFGLRIDGEHVYKGKSFLYGDILYSLGVPPEDLCIQMHNKYINHAKFLEGIMDKNDSNYEKYEFAYYLYKICKVKSDLALNLQKKYKEGDLQYLKTIADDVLVNLKEMYVTLKKLHKKMWMSVYKPFGFEVLSLRYGAVMSRIDDTIEIINDYLDKKTDKIEELEQEILDTQNIYSCCSDVLSPTGAMW